MRRSGGAGGVAYPMPSILGHKELQVSGLCPVTSTGRRSAGRPAALGLQWGRLPVSALQHGSSMEPAQVAQEGVHAVDLCGERL